MIRYHGMPMWPQNVMARVMVGRHALVSYARPEQMEIAVEVCDSVCVDNGVFQAWVNGERPDFAGYHDFVVRWAKHPAVDWFVIPDDIDGNEADNNALLLAWDLPKAISVPVYHMHESLERLERLMSEYPRVAIGSSGQYATIQTPAWWTRIAEIMGVACDNEGYPRCRLHGLRQLDTTITSHIPYSSADSSTAAQGIVYDQRWTGSYAPRSKEVKAIVIMDRIERHPCASRWNNSSAGVQQNMELVG